MQELYIATFQSAVISGWNVICGDDNNTIVYSFVMHSIQQQRNYEQIMHTWPAVICLMSKTDVALLHAHNQTSDTEQVKYHQTGSVCLLQYNVRGCFTVMTTHKM